MGLRLVMVTAVAFFGAVPVAGTVIADPNSGGSSAETAPPREGGCGAPAGKSCNEAGGGRASTGQSGGGS